MDPCAGLHILAHGSIPLPYLPNLCAVLRPAPLASYYFPFLSFPLLSPCIGLSLDLVLRHPIRSTGQPTVLGLGLGIYLEHYVWRMISSRTKSSSQKTPRHPTDCSVLQDSLLTRGWGISPCTKDTPAIQQDTLG